MPKLEGPRGGRRGDRPDRYEDVDAEPAQQEPPQRRAGRDGLPDRRARGLRGSADYYAQADEAVPAAVRRRSRDGWRQPGSAFKPIIYATGIDGQELTAGVDVHGRRDRLRRRLHADRRRQPRARPGPPARRPPLLAQHPGRQGDGASSASSTVQRQAAGVRASTSPTDKIDAGAGVRAGRGGGPPAGPRPGLRHARERGRLVRPDDDPAVVQDNDGQGPRRGEHERPEGRARHQPRGRLRHRPTSWPATPIPRETRSGASSRSRRQDSDAGRRRSRPAPTTTPRDLNAYGYIAPPTDRRPRGRRVRAGVGAWNGNSDNSLVSTAGGAARSRSTSRRYVWQGFLEEATEGWADQRLRAARRPRGARGRSVDGARAARGGNAGDELFAGRARSRARAGRGALRRGRSCRAAGFEDEHETWLEADRDWIAAGAPRTGRRGRAGEHADELLLQRPLHPVRAVLGAGRRERQRQATRAPRRRRRRSARASTPSPARWRHPPARHRTLQRRIRPRARRPRLRRRLRRSPSPEPVVPSPPPESPSPPPSQEPPSPPPSVEPSPSPDASAAAGDGTGSAEPSP